MPVADGIPILLVVLGLVCLNVLVSTVAFRKGRRIVGARVLAPVIAVASHFNPLLWAEGSWAPTFRGDVAATVAANGRRHATR